MRPGLTQLQVGPVVTGISGVQVAGHTHRIFRRSRHLTSRLAVPCRRPRSQRAAACLGMHVPRKRNEE